MWLKISQITETDSNFSLVRFKKSYWFDLISSNDDDDTQSFVNRARSITRRFDNDFRKLA